MKLLHKKAILYLIIILSFTTSCVSVASYQKMYLDDTEMQLSTRTIEVPEVNFQSYREGASGGNKGKSGGGCGCN